MTKAATHEIKDIFIYFIDKIPYFFRIDKEDQLLPTGELSSTSYFINHQFIKKAKYLLN